MNEEKVLETQNKTHQKSNKLDQIVELSLLYDFYGALLKENQRQVFEDYICNDLSLSEIAADRDISRQGVYDIIKRCSKQLSEYEEKLNLIDKFYKTRDRVNQIHQIAKEMKKTGKMECVTPIESIETIEILSYQILDEF